VINWTIIAINCLVFLYELFCADQNALITVHGFVPQRFIQDFGLQQISTIFTAMFMHAGFAHLIGNMWVLAVFGDNVEDKMGHCKYLCFYMVIGVLAFISGMFFNQDPAEPSIGASGAIAGVLGAYIVMFPQSKVLTFIPVFFFPLFFQVSAWFFLGFWFFVQALPIFAPQLADHAVAWWAHVGGFISGMVLVSFFEDKRSNPKAAMYSYLKDRHKYR
ncbi:MAG: rhomboid family intramembrane serine protease, partial [Terriglobales bacterium]